VAGSGAATLTSKPMPDAKVENELPELLENANSAAGTVFVRPDLSCVRWHN